MTMTITPGDVFRSAIEASGSRRAVYLTDAQVIALSKAIDHEIEDFEWMLDTDTTAEVKVLEGIRKALRKE